MKIPTYSLKKTIRAIFCLFFTGTSLFYPLADNANAGAVVPCLLPESGLSGSGQAMSLQASLICRLIEKRAEYGLKEIYLDDIFKWRESSEYLFRGCVFERIFEGKSLAPDSRISPDEVRITIPFSGESISYFFYDPTSLPDGGEAVVRISDGLFRRITFTRRLKAPEKNADTEEEKLKLSAGTIEEIEGFKLGKGFLRGMKNQISTWHLDAEAKDRLAYINELFMEATEDLPETSRKIYARINARIKELLDKGDIMTFESLTMGEDNYLLMFTRGEKIFIGDSFFPVSEGKREAAFFLIKALARAVYEMLFGPGGAEEFFPGGKDLSCDKQLEEKAVEYVRSKMPMYNPMCAMEFLEDEGEYDKLFKFEIKDNILEALFGWRDSEWRIPSERKTVDGVEIAWPDEKYAASFGFFYFRSYMTRVRVNLDSGKVYLVEPGGYLNEGDVIELDSKQFYFEKDPDGNVTVFFRNLARERFPYNAQILYKLVYKPWTEKWSAIWQEAFNGDFDLMRRDWTHIYNAQGDLSITRQKQRDMRKIFGRSLPWSRIEPYDGSYSAIIEMPEDMFAETARARNRILADWRMLKEYTGYRDGAYTPDELDNMKFNVRFRCLGPRGEIEKSIILRKEDFIDSGAFFDSESGQFAERIKKEYPGFGKDFSARLELEARKDFLSKPGIDMDVTVYVPFSEQVGDISILAEYGHESDISSAVELITRTCARSREKFKDRRETIFIRYNDNLFSAEQKQIIHEYRKLLIRALKLKDRDVRVAPFASEYMNIPAISHIMLGIYRYKSPELNDKDLLGEGSNGKGLIAKAAEIAPSDLPVTALLNMALAASYITPGRSSFTHDDHIAISFLKKQYFFCTGEELPNSELPPVGKLLSDKDAKRIHELSYIYIPRSRPVSTDYFTASLRALISA
ncbi:MAG: hypothetical protein ABH883_01800 [Candidatus Omnitrophota bacterium]